MKKSRPQRIVKQSLRRLLIGLLGFTAFWTVNAFLETADQLELSQSSCFNPGRDATPPFYDSVYTAFLNWIGNETSSQVSMVVIKADLDDIQQNLCNGRGYIADLLTAIATQHPSAIVIDKYFSPNSCAQNPASTRELLTAVRSLQVPVILGESTDVGSQETDGSCLVQKQQLEFDSSNVHRGLLRLNANREQIPLKWPVLSKQPPASGFHKDKKPSLALESLKVFAPQLVRSANFQLLLEDAARQPYARIERDTLPETNSTDLLCSAGTPAMRKRWSLHCSATGQKSDLLGKLVLVGAQNEVDHWVVLGKQMWGFELQANYIDALLSGRYLRAASSDQVLVLFGIFLLCLEFGPIAVDWWFFRSKRELPRLFYPCWYSSLTIVFVISMVLFFVSRHYLPPLSMLFGAILAGLTHLLILGSGWTEEQARPRRTIESEVKR